MQPSSINRQRARRAGIACAVAGAAFAGATAAPAGAIVPGIDLAGPSGLVGSPTQSFTVGGVDGLPLACTDNDVPFPCASGANSRDFSDGRHVLRVAVDPPVATLDVPTAVQTTFTVLGTDITSGPAEGEGIRRYDLGSKAKFTYAGVASDDFPGLLMSYVCAVDDEDPAPCAAEGTALPNLRYGVHSFSVSAVAFPEIPADLPILNLRAALVEAAGVADLMPATRTFKVFSHRRPVRRPGTKPTSGSQAVPQKNTAAGGVLGAVQDNLGPDFSLTLSRTRFAAAPSGAAFVAQAGEGTVITYGLSEAATVKLRFLRKAAPGDWRGAGKISAPSKRGETKVRFRGRMKGKALAPGKYRLRATATDAAGNRGSNVVVAPFRITG